MAHGHIGIGNGDDPGSDGDPLPADPGGISRTVKPLVVVQDDQPLPVEEADVLKHGHADSRMFPDAFHDDLLSI